MIEAKNITRTFTTGKVATTVLKGIDLFVPQGQFLAIMGRSGAGKSTLLYQLSLLDTPSSGHVVLHGIDTASFSQAEATAFRLNHLGFVFQDYALLPELTAVDNVMLPLLMRGIAMSESRTMAIDALRRVGVSAEVMYGLPNRLSGGEQQRVSIARAIAHRPEILFADEPTANLDSVTAKLVIDQLLELNRGGQTIVMVTHEEEYGRESNRIVRLNDGLIVSDTMTNTMAPQRNTSEQPPHRFF